MTYVHHQKEKRRERGQAYCKVSQENHYGGRAPGIQG